MQSCHKMVLTVEQIPEKIANYNFMIQTIMGDKTDGYDGIEGVGIKTAEKATSEIY